MTKDQFFDDLEPEEEYALVVIKASDYECEFFKPFNEKTALLHIKQNHNHYSTDEIYKQLYNENSKTKKALSKREFELNHG
jgi:tRNA nucleotidyltransferase (CCA-adding enzyme)